MPPKQMNKRPLFISIQGNIGSGKSTIINAIRQSFPQISILDQPVAQWQNLGEKKNINLLSLYYQDPQRWGFTFQIFAFMTRLTKWCEYSKMNETGIKISQRSLLSDRYVFASIMRDSNFLDETEHEVYLQFYNRLTQMNDIVDLFGIIYVRCPAEICTERIKKRSREGEGSIPLDYLQKLNDKHEEWLNKEKSQKILIIDNTTPFEKEQTISTISNWIARRNSTLNQTS